MTSMFWQVFELVAADDIAINDSAVAPENAYVAPDIQEEVRETCSALRSRRR
jgi:hypothetical protein